MAALVEPHEPGDSERAISSFAGRRGSMTPGFRLAARGQSRRTFSASS
jgi:hypothetical protein